MTAVHVIQTHTLARSEKRKRKVERKEGKIQRSYMLTEPSFSPMLEVFECQYLIGAL